MAENRKYTMLATLVGLTALPAAASLLYFYFSGDPTLRPLGITHEQITDHQGEVRSLAIIVDVDWGQDHDGTFSQNDLRNLVGYAFSTFTDEFAFRFKDVPGEDIAVTFSVGPNRFGPYAPGQINSAVIPSSQALSMAKRAAQ